MSILKRFSPSVLLKSKLPLKKIGLMLTFLLFAAFVVAQTRQITDVTGRKVLIPQKVERIFAMSAIGTLYIYALAPQKMIGWNYSLTPAEKKYILPQLHNLPNLGGAGGTAVNYEQLLFLKPDVIVMFQFQDAERAADIEKKTGIPVVIFDNALKAIPESLLVLGDITGEQKRAGELAEYAKQTLNSADYKAKNPVSVYYAEGKDGLLTEPAGSDHAEVIAYSGAANAAQIPAKTNQTAVSLEQVLAWNPQVIIAWAQERGGYAQGIIKDPLWKDITAVKNSQVYAIPNTPFNWVDRPYSVNRLLGIRWLRSLLYPEHFTQNPVKTVQEFYTLFYWYDLTEKEAQELLQTRQK